jgi:hypothetical protein
MSEPEQLETAEAFMDRVRRTWTNRAFRTKDVGRQGWHHWMTEAVTVMQQSNHPHKVLIIQRVTLTRLEGTRAYAVGAEVGSREYRIGYFMRGQIGRAKNRWTWGQYAAFIPAEDFEMLLMLARREGTILGH